MKRRDIKVAIDITCKNQGNPVSQLLLESALFHYSKENIMDNAYEKTVDKSIELCILPDATVGASLTQIARMI